jgi:hypothetical protein
MHDRAPRRRVLKGAKIILNNGASVIDALARNQSEGGVSLEVATTAGIPGEFQLQLSGEVERHCQVRWKRTGRIGVKFLET